MNLQFLRYAAEVEKTGSFTQAAENLYMNQPHLSRAVRELEKEMGFSIFNRTGRGIVPTEAGEEFLRHAKEVLAKVDQLEQLKDKNEKKKYCLCLAAVRAEYIQNAVAAFAAEHTGEKEMSLHFEETGAREVISRVGEKVCSLGITRYPSAYASYYQKLMKEKNLVYHELVSFPYLVVMKKNHSLAEKKELTYLDLAQYTEVIYGSEIIPDFSFSADSQEGKKCIYVQDKDSGRQMVKLVPGAYMWDAPGSEALNLSQGLVQRICSRPGNEYKDVAIYRQDCRQTEAEKRLLRIVENEAVKSKKIIERITK